VSWFLAVNLQHAISRPILSLAATAREISQNKDYTIRAPFLGDPKSHDKNELVILTESFNTMLSEINERNQQLKQQNAELEKARDAAESANRAKSQFLANISHELRTPLNAVIGFSSILMNQLFGPLGEQKYLEYARDINESGTHLLDIINDILDLSKAEAGKLMLNYEEVHIGKAINKCVTILSERAARGKVVVVTDIPKMLPPLMADRLRFIQVVLNILSNAIKFTDEGGKIYITARAEDKNGEIESIVLTIRDTGIGLSPQDIQKAFQSFGQVDSGLNRKYEGTGLGLPLTRKLMELHRGHIDIESEQGKGTLVTLTFPATAPGDTDLPL
jgi:two-component system cell cycle sensor histidine kinase PleC